jgi:GPH family glycoside/pentoside/hexuronide:cation symporter
MNDSKLKHRDSDAAQRAAAAGPLTAARKIAIGIGDFGFNFYWQIASLYLLYFYTDVLKLPPATAGAIYMAALIWDGALDPIVGLLADRTRSRFGRYRPYLLLGAVPLAVAFVLMLASPAYPASGAVALTTITHFAFRTLYAVVSVPFTALSARITRDAAVRADITAARMVSATLSAVLVAMATLPLVALFARTLGARLAWIILGGLYAVCATAILLATAFAAKGLDASTEEDPQGPGFLAKLRATGANWPLFLVLLAVAVTSFVNTIFQKNILYYFKYVVGDAKRGSWALGVMALVAAISVPLWAFVARRWGKRVAWLAGLAPFFIGVLLWYFADGSDTLTLFMALGVTSFGSGAYYVSFWAMLPDTVEFGEWRTGVRSESLAFGLLVLGQKAALGLGAGFLGLTLSRTGYVADHVQSAATIHAIKDMMLWAPLIGGVIAGVLISFYPISPARHRAMVQEIADRPRT